MTRLPFKTVRELLKESAFPKRVSSQAVIEADIALQDYLFYLTKQSSRLVEGEGKKVIKARHIRMIRELEAKK